MKIQLKDQEITFRKWKGKDKKNFMKEMSQPVPDEIKIMQALVYNCIEEKDIVLSTDEFKYVISMIRAASLGNEIDYNFFCTECENTVDRKYYITDIIKGKYGHGNTIQAKGVDITLGDIRNKEFYMKKIQEGSIFDFLLRIKEINGNDSFDLEFLMDFFDELDLDVLDDVLQQYDDIRFKVDDINDFVCDCGHIESYHFDELPEFFPSQWFDSESLISSLK